jgi:hypothetical protein
MAGINMNNLEDLFLTIMMALATWKILDVLLWLCTYTGENK